MHKESKKSRLQNRKRISMDQNYNILENFEIVGVQVEGFEVSTVIMAFVGWLILVLIGFFTINLILRA